MLFFLSCLLILNIGFGQNKISLAVWDNKLVLDKSFQYLKK